MTMKRSVFLVSAVFQMLAGNAVLAAEEGAAPSAVVVPATTPAAAPKPPVPPAAPVVVPKPVPVEKEKPAAAQPPASPPIGTPEPTHSGDLPAGRDTKTVAGPAIAPDGLAGYLWPAFSFAMLIVGFAAGYFWRHHVSRQKLGGMTVRIGTWRGTP